MRVHLMHRLDRGVFGQDPQTACLVRQSDKQIWRLRASLQTEDKLSHSGRSLAEPLTGRTARVGFPIDLDYLTGEP